MSDRSCKYCGQSIRWCRDEAGRWLPLDQVKVAATEPRAEFVVVGAEDARRVAKANRAKFGELYRRHVCEQGENARALARREQRDRAEGRAIRRQFGSEQATLPGNVQVLRNWRKR